MITLKTTHPDEGEWLNQKPKLIDEIKDIEDKIHSMELYAWYGITGLRFNFQREDFSVYWIFIRRENVKDIYPAELRYAIDNLFNF